MEHQHATRGVVVNTCPLIYPPLASLNRFGASHLDLGVSCVKNNKH